MAIAHYWPQAQNSSFEASTSTSAASSGYRSAEPTPFRTRLGLPAVYDPTLVTVAVRDLVNEGRIAAFPAGGSGYFQGPFLPVPDEVPNELFERMLL
jgi:hypothetical protein